MASAFSPSRSRFDFGPGTESSGASDYGPVPEVSRLIGKFREELHRGLSSSGPDEDEEDEDEAFDRNFHQGAAATAALYIDSLSEPEYNDYNDGGLLAPSSSSRQRRRRHEYGARDKYGVGDNDDEYDGTADAGADARLLSLGPYAPAGAFDEVRRRIGLSDSDEGEEAAMWGRNASSASLRRKNRSSNRSLRKKVDAFRNSLDHIEDDLGASSSDEFHGDRGPSYRRNGGGYGSSDDEDYNVGATRRSLRRHDNIGTRGHRNGNGNNNVAFGNAASIRQDLQGIINDFKDLPSRLNRSRVAEDETKASALAGTALVEAESDALDFKEDDLVEAVRSAASSSKKQRKKKKSSKQRKKAWCEGRIDRVTRSGKFDIRFHDGKWAYGVERHNIRFPRLNVSVGDDVEARYLGQKWWVKGKVTSVNEDGTFDLVYRDGGTETRVRPRLVRKVPREHGEGQLSLREGDSVEFKFVGMKRWERATVRGLNGNGTFNLADSTGKEINEVSGCFLRRQTSGHQTAETVDHDDVSQFHVKDKVEARRTESRVWERGKIKYVHVNGRYDIAFDSGERERYVPAEFVRARTKFSKQRKAKKRSKSKTRRRSSSSSDASQDAFARGDAVEGRFAGKDKWYPAKITRCVNNGTYDLLYEDGDMERGVDSSCVRRKGDQGSQKSSRRHAKGYGGSSDSSGSSSTSSSSSSSDSSSSNSDGSSSGNSSSASASNRKRSKKKKKKNKKKKSRSNSSGEDENSDKFERGDQVEANFGGRGKWYPAKITLCNSDGTYDLFYADGDVERGVKLDNVRPVGGKRKSSSSSFSKGDKVEANYAGKGKWYKGTIASKNSNGTYDLLYEDGDKERGVPSDRIRAVGGSQSGGGRGKYREGQSIECRYGGRSQYFKGRIRAVNSDGTYYVKYDNGGEERNVQESWIRSTGGGRSGSSSDSDSDRAPANAQFRLNEKVECNFGGRGKWFKGKIGHVNRNGTFDVFYDDGDRERGVKPDRLRSIEGGSSTGGGGSFSVGDAVEANFGGKGKWYKGKISAAHSNGTFDVLYDDGDKERGVRSENLRAIGGSSSNGAGSTFFRGDKVEANFGGRGKWYKAEITFKNSNGTYDLLYEDGDKERGIPSDRIRAVGGSQSGGGRGKYREGQSIECRYGGRSQYFKGRIRAVNSDGTYYVKYDNGGEERNVQESWIRSTGGGRSGSSSDSDSDRAPANAQFRLNEKVECNFGGRGKWFKGKIGHVNRNGTFDVFYDDGDRERGVKPDRLRSIEGGSSTGGGGSFSVGDAVEANFGGKGKWYKGKISAAHSNGTFDVLYDDGDKERGVRSENLRAIGGSSSNGAGSTFFRGDKVEANFGGRGKWYKAEITFKNSNGTYDLLYEDGDKERGVPSDRIRAVGGSQSGGGRGKYREGQSIECRYGGRSQYFKGRIRAVNSDGTYYVKYDNGGEERNVQESWIRSTGGGRSGSSSDSDSDRAPANAQFRLNEKVECNFGGRGKWFKGKIGHVNRNGTFDVFYDDGDRERGVKPDRLRSIEGGSSTGGGGSFSVGDAVEANFGGKGKWYKGKISAAHSNGTFDVLYDDGDKERGVRSENLRAIGGSSAGASFREGDSAECNFGGRGKWYKAKVTRVNGNGTFDVLYEDGDRERGIGSENIRHPGGSASQHSGSSQSLALEDKVEVNFGGRGKWYKGKISHVHSNGTFDVLYDDGDKERGVKAENIRALDGGDKNDSSSSSSDSDEAAYNVGDEIEGNYAGKGKWYKGKIKAVNGNGTFDLLYDDGDTERGVTASNVRLVGGAAKSGKKAKKKKKKKKGGNSSSSSSSSSSSEGGDAETAYSEGDEIEGNYAGKGKWYKGKIKAVNGNGTFDLLYDDGDTERGVTASNVRLVGGAAKSGKKAKKKKKKKKGGNSSSSSSSSSNSDEAAYSEGDEIEGNYAGKGKWYKGKIKAVNGNGTFDLLYDDGDTERGVTASNVRLVGGAAKSGKKAKKKKKKKKGGNSSSSSSSSSSSEGGDAETAYSEGDEIEGNYAGKGKWYKGKIKAVNGNGTFDLLYDDGDTERGVTASNVRLVGGAAKSGKKAKKKKKKKKGGNSSSSSSSSSSSEGGDTETVYSEGDEIEGNYAGKGKWYKGKIKAVNGNGTFDLLYDDGDTERGVNAVNVRRIKGTSTSSRQRRNQKSPKKRKKKIKRRKSGSTKSFSSSESSNNNSSSSGSSSGSNEGEHRSRRRGSKHRGRKLASSMNRSIRHVRRIEAELMKKMAKLQQSRLKDVRVFAFSISSTCHLVPRLSFRNRLVPNALPNFAQNCVRCAGQEGRERNSHIARGFCRAN